MGTAASVCSPRSLRRLAKEASQFELSEAGREQIEAAFKQYDRDGSGHVDLEELEVLLESLLAQNPGEAMAFVRNGFTPADIRHATFAVMRVCDKSNNLKLSLREFRPLYVLALREAKQGQFLHRIREAHANGELDRDHQQVINAEACGLGDAVADGRIAAHGGSAKAAQAAASFIRLGNGPNYRNLSSRNLLALGVPQSLLVDDTINAHGACALTAEFVVATAAALATQPLAAKDKAASQKVVRNLLGNKELLQHAPGTVQELHAVCRQKLDAVLQESDARVYEPMGLAQKLGDLGAGPSSWNQDARQDAADVLGEGLFEACGFDEYEFLVSLLLLAAAVQDDFQSFVGGVAEATEGMPEHGPLKTYERMWNLMWGEGAGLEEPRPAANLDVCRSSIVYTNPQKLAEGFTAATRRHRPVSVRNTFHPDVDRSCMNFRLCSIVLASLYCPAAADGTRLTWDTYLDAALTEEKLAMLRKELVLGEDRLLDGVERLKDALRGRPVSFIVETEFALQDYVSLRKENELWHSILHAPDGDSLVALFSKHAARREIRPEVGDDRVETGKHVIVDLDKLTTKDERPTSPTHEERTATYETLLKLH